MDLRLSIVRTSSSSTEKNHHQTTNMSLDSKALEQLEQVSKHLLHAYSLIHPDKNLDFKDASNASVEERLARLEWIADVFEGKQTSVPKPSPAPTPAPAPSTPAPAPTTTATPAPTPAPVVKATPTPAPHVEAKKETPKPVEQPKPVVTPAPVKTPAPATTTPAKPASTPAPAPASSTPAPSGKITQFYSYERLKKEKIDGVDPNTKELWLSDDEFKSVFGMTKAEWTVAPVWKKTQKKKEKNMF